MLLLMQVDKQWQGYTWQAYAAGTLGIVYAIIGNAWKYNCIQLYTGRFFNFSPLNLAKSQPFYKTHTLIFFLQFYY